MSESKKYNPSEIESKWQKHWQESGVYKTEADSDKESFYILDMFPYPSGEGLHVGHPKGYIATDIYSRLKRMQGFNVLHPMGFDAFGLPAEQYAIKNKLNPNLATAQNVARYKEQLEILGLDYDWSREVNTTDPKFYKWTQWCFKQMYKAGLVSESYEPINWCPKDMTGLANEDVENGMCERCGTLVEKKPLRQWSIRITDYADRLLADLDKLDWEPHIKELQRNWIGKSEGAEIDFEVSSDDDYIILHGFNSNGEDDFIPWIKEELLKSKGSSVYNPTLPNPDKPNAKEQAYFVLQHNKLNGNTVLIGHSFGCVGALRIAERSDIKIKRLVLVSGFAEPGFLDKKRNFEDTTDWNFDFKKIKENVDEIFILRPTNDSAVPKERADFLRSKLGCTIVDFVAQDDHACGTKEPEILKYAKSKLTVFTTRPDTLFGVTYLAVSYELAQKWIDSGIQMSDELKTFITKLAETEKNKVQDYKEVIEKRGMDTGLKAVHPITKEVLPIWVANYVLSGYGTGAVMAVPAHDERDFEFATKYNLPIKEVVRPYVVDHVNVPRLDKETVIRENVHAIVRDPKTNKFLILRNKEHAWDTVVIGGIENNENPTDAAIREIREETGYTNLRYIRTLGNPVQAGYFAKHKNQNRVAISTSVYFELAGDERVELAEDEGNEILWIDEKDFVPGKMINSELSIWLERLRSETDVAYTGKGVLINSGEFDGIDFEESKIKITEKADGRKKSQYKLRDWVFARQRYWGEPFPIVFDENHVPYVVADSELPVILPPVENYEPTDTGESPLALIKDWVEIYGYINDDNEFVSMENNLNWSEEQLKTIDLYNKNTETYVAKTPVDNLSSSEHSKKIKNWIDSFSTLLGDNKTILEIGSGAGRDYKYLTEKNIKVFPTDISTGFVEHLKSIDVPAEVFDPLKDDYSKYKNLDGIFARASLLHTNKHQFEKILCKFNRSLPNNGLLAISLKKDEKPENSKPKLGAPRYYQYYSEEYIKSIASRLGFEITYFECVAEANSADTEWLLFILKKKEEVKLFKRETNTMPQWAGSSWYYLRYIDPHNDSTFVDKNLEKKWSPVDFYVGGAEHATRHLIYARFWHKFLFDHGYVSQDEPFTKLQTVGLIMAEDGRKMSKRWGNVVNPDDVIAQYGADTLRVYEMFMGPFDQSVAWSTDNMIGSRRFIERVWKLQEKIINKAQIDEVLFNGTIKKITEDILEFKLNTAVSQMMTLLNAVEKTGITKEDYKIFLKLLAPFAPHMTEELWNLIGNTTSIHQSEWPVYDKTKLESDTIIISIQINGKLRGTIEVIKNETKENIIALAKNEPTVAKWLGDAQIKKEIYVPGKLINFVV